MNITRHLTKTKYGYVHSRTTGESNESPDLLFLHQVPASSRIWASVMSKMKNHSIAPDMLNMGESDRTKVQLTLEEHAETMWEAAQEISPGPKILVGHHTGATMAAILAEKYPNQVKGTMLIGYPYYTNWEEKLAKYSRLNQAIDDGTGEDLVTIWQFIKKAFVDQSNYDLMFDAFADRMRAGRVWYEGYIALWNSDLNGILSRLASLDSPTQVVAPERDILSKNATFIAESANASLVECEGGAFILTEKPELLAEIITDFIERVQ